MALGSNMKKSAAKPPKKEEKSAVKKKLISKPKPAKATKKTKPKKVAESKASNKVENFISSQREAYRANVRKRFNQEIEDNKSKQIQFLIFEIGRSKFAIEVDRVREVSQCDQLTPTPMSHPHLAGIIQFRNRTFVGVDLANKFGVGEKGELNFSVVLKHVNRVALLLPKIPSTAKISGAIVQPLNKLVADAALDEVYIKGIFEDKGETIFYLDLGELIRSDEAIVVPEEIIND